MYLCLRGLVSCVLQCLQLGKNHEYLGPGAHLCMYESPCELVICVEYLDVHVCLNPVCI